MQIPVSIYLGLGVVIGMLICIVIITFIHAEFSHGGIKK